MATDEQDWQSSGPSLNSDGSIENRMKAVEPVGSTNTGSAAAPVEPTLELGERAVPGPANIDPQYRDLSGVDREARRQRRARTAVTVLLLVGGIAAVGAWFGRDAIRDALNGDSNGLRPSTWLDSAMNRGSRVVVIDSEPAGARITAGTSEIGTTPWSGDSRLPPGTEITLSLKGHERLTVPLPEGPEPRLSVSLKPLPRRQPKTLQPQE